MSSYIFKVPLQKGNLWEVYLSISYLLAHNLLIGKFTPLILGQVFKFSKLYIWAFWHSSVSAALASLVRVLWRLTTDRVAPTTNVYFYDLFSHENPVPGLQTATCSLHSLGVCPWCTSLGQRERDLLALLLKAGNPIMRAPSSQTHLILISFQSLHLQV